MDERRRITRPRVFQSRHSLQPLGPLEVMQSGGGSGNARIGTFTFLRGGGRKYLVQFLAKTGLKTQTKPTNINPD